MVNRVFRRGEKNERCRCATQKASAFKPNKNSRRPPRVMLVTPPCGHARYCCMAVLALWGHSGAYDVWFVLLWWRELSWGSHLSLRLASQACESLCNMSTKPNSFSLSWRSWEPDNTHRRKDVDLCPCIVFVSNSTAMNLNRGVQWTFNVNLGPSLWLCMLFLRNILSTSTFCQHNLNTFIINDPSRILAVCAVLPSSSFQMRLVMQKVAASCSFTLEWPWGLQICQTLQICDWSIESVIVMALVWGSSEVLFVCLILGTNKSSFWGLCQTQ